MESALRREFLISTKYLKKTYEESPTQMPITSQLKEIVTRNTRAVSLEK